MVAGMTMMHQFQPAAALTRPKPDRIGFEPALGLLGLASGLLANRNTFVDRAVHRDAAGACTRVRTRTALRACTEQQNRGSGGKEKFHDACSTKTEFDFSLAARRDSKATLKDGSGEAPRATYAPKRPIHGGIEASRHGGMAAWRHGKYQSTKLAKYQTTEPPKHALPCHGHRIFVAAASDNSR
jgi:hypothetical protein